MRAVQRGLATMAALILFGILPACHEKSKTGVDNDEADIFVEREHEAILAALNNETKAAFARDYEAWQDKWVHDTDITKTYINFIDSTFSESVGWQEVDQFVKTFFK